MSMFNVSMVSMCEVDEIGAKELMALFKPYRHDHSALFEQVNKFATRLQLDESEIGFFITELKSRFNFTEGSLAYSIAFAMSDYAESVYRYSKFSEEEKEDIFQQYMDLSF